MITSQAAEQPRQEPEHTHNGTGDANARRQVNDRRNRCRGEQQPESESQRSVREASVEEGPDQATRCAQKPKAPDDGKVDIGSQPPTSKRRRGGMRNRDSGDGSACPETHRQQWRQQASDSKPRNGSRAAAEYRKRENAE